MNNPRVMIVTGDGLNCELETAYAFRLAGAEPRLVHISDLLAGRDRLADYSILAFIGGFSNGDHLGAGTVQAGRFKLQLREELERFIARKNAIIGICNGFQTLVKLGILPGGGHEAGPRRMPDAGYGSRNGGRNGGWTQTATIMANDSGKFEDRWVHLLLNPASPCVWTRGLDRLFLPVRHGEGKFYTDRPGLIEAMERSGQIVARYTDESYRESVMDYPCNPSGSLGAIAAVCDAGGTICGMMPHPEAYLSAYNHPSWTRERAAKKTLSSPGAGAAIFARGVEYARQS
jgi:phosphoribosylformylglycinamidine synthase I